MSRDVEKKTVYLVIHINYVPIYIKFILVYNESVYKNHTFHIKN